MRDFPGTPPQPQKIALVANQIFKSSARCAIFRGPRRVQGIVLP
jgi:hypothetical protein